MNWKTNLRLALTALFLGLASSFGMAAKTQAVVVVVKSGGALEDLTLKDIQAIYMGEKLFQGSSKIEPLMNGDEGLAEVFFGKILGKTRNQYKKVWKSKAFVDAVEAPAVLPSSEDVLRAVDKDDDAIGFVAENDLGATEKKKLKVVYSSDNAK
jgi:ABC-type phosphate transport system substrate-binding protein